MEMSLSDYLLNNEKFKDTITRPAGADQLNMPCPNCIKGCMTGTDRFIIFLNSEKFWCRKCNCKGNLVDFLVNFEGKSKHEALKIVYGENRKPGSSKGKLINGMNKHFLPEKSQLEPYEGVYYAAPTNKFNDKAQILIAECNHRLNSDEKILEWLLLERGINKATANKFKLGFNPIDIYFDKSEWGVEPDKDLKTGNVISTKLIVPAGIIIPSFINYYCERLRIRRFSPTKEQSRYHIVKSSSLQPMEIQGTIPENIMIIVESDLDAYLINSVNPEISILSLGSCNTQPSYFQFNYYLPKFKQILISLDNDEAGAKWSKVWLRQFPNNSKRLPPIFAKDLCEMWKKNIDLSEWLKVGIC